MNPFFSWRKTQQDDLSEALRLHPAKNGAEVVGPSRCLEAWQQLSSITHASRSAVVLRNSGGKTEIVGFGFGAFVKKSFADAEVQNPAPGLNSRIIERVVTGKTVAATYDEVKEANTEGDLQQVILDTSWKHGHLDNSEVDEVRVLLGRAYQELHSGYRLSRLLSELVDERDHWHVRGLQSFQIISRYEAYRRENPDTSWNSSRALVAVTAESSRADFHSIASGLFQHHPEPQLGFTQGEQLLLETALEGADDASASKILFIGIPAIKRRWEKIFDRVAAVRPDLCPDDANGTRGVQKRQRILTYVRNHPEEIRPFNFSRQKSRATTHA